MERRFECSCTLLARFHRLGPLSANSVLIEDKFTGFKFSTVFPACSQALTEYFTAFKYLSQGIEIRVFFVAIFILKANCRWRRKLVSLKFRLSLRLVLFCCFTGGIASTCNRSFNSIKIHLLQNNRNFMNLHEIKVN